MGTPIATIKAIHELGENDKERAARLRVTPRTVTEYKAGRIPEKWRKLMYNISVLEALLEDARAGRANGNHTEAQP
jgi:hypothetical protein